MRNSCTFALSLLLTAGFVGTTAFAAESTVSTKGGFSLGTGSSSAKASASTSTAAPKPEASSTAATNDVPKDPKGIKGISPAWEAIVAGDAALVAHDPDTAMQHYNDAVKSDPHNPWAHYRLAEAQLQKGQMDEAQASLQTAVASAKEDAVVKAKALFMLADLAERRTKLDDANSGWAHYSEHVAAHKDVKGFPASASDRQQRIAARQDSLVKYAAVAERIKSREAEITAKAMSDAQKQK